ncbi:MAG: hypothetical protein AB7P20_03070 [Rhizobiaceae bacterium]
MSHFRIRPRVASPAPAMKRPANTGAVIGINVQFLLAGICGLAAWKLWPTSPEWWGLGVMSVMLGMAAFGGVANAVRAMTTLYRKDRALAEYLALGGAPKAARLATLDQLRQAGMIDE